MEHNIIDINKLNFKDNKVNEITMEQLKRTVEPKDCRGIPLGGIYHYQFVDEVQERAAKLGLQICIWEMFAANNADRYLPGVIVNNQLENRYGENAIEAHQLNRVFTNCRIQNFDDADYTTNIAISYHQKGIQVAVGSNVKICHNQMIIGTKDFYAATYSDRGRGSRRDMPDPHQLLDIVEGYMAQIGDRVYEQRRKIESMKNVILTPEQLFIFIGMLQCTRVAMDSKDSRIRRQGIYPLGNSEINKFTEKIMIRQKDNDVVTLWDCYDIATNLYKPAFNIRNNDEVSTVFGMEIPNILPQNYAMAEFIENWQVEPTTKSIAITA